VAKDRPPASPFADATRKARGDAAEAAACAHLQRAGLQLLVRNARYRVGELDLVMLDGAQLVFVEVRYRQSAMHGSGADSVDARKRQRLVRAARAFLAAHPAHAQRACRFDVVEASGPPLAPTLHWHRDAFRVDD
jgi:putative endonuclease